MNAIKALNSCRQASRLITVRQDRPLSVLERVSLRVHLTLCASCRRFARQIIFLDRTLREHGERLDTVRLPARYLEAAQQRIIDRLRASPEAAPGSGKPENPS